MKRVLVVANETLTAPALIEAIRGRAAAGHCAFHLVVPATRPGPPLGDENGDGRTIAKERLGQAVAGLAWLGVLVGGEVGDASPIVAAAAAARRDTFDEAVVCTSPPGCSRWLKMGVARRLERFLGIPVQHVVVTTVATGPATGD
jgi:hypothetical protein